jgi:Ras association (RalGDS/AF-6) domain
LAANGVFSNVTIETQVEDEHQRVVTQSLLVARQCAVNELEDLEDSEPLGHSGPELSQSVENMAGFRSAVSASRGMRSPNRHSRIMDGALLPSPSVLGDTQERRSSVILNEVMPGNPTEMRRLTWEDALSSPYIRAQPVHLLRKWTEQGSRLSKLVANDDEDILQDHNSDHSLQENDSETRLGIIPEFTVASGHYGPPQDRPPFRSHSRSKSDPSTTRGTRHTLQDQNSPFTTISNAEQDPIVSPDLSAIQSVGPKVEIFKSFRVSMDDPCYKVLPAALKEYNINTDWRQYDFYIVYGDQERVVGLNEKPLILFKQLDNEGKKPMFMLRKNAGYLEWLRQRGL